MQHLIHDCYYKNPRTGDHRLWHPRLPVLEIIRAVYLTDKVVEPARVYGKETRQREIPEAIASGATRRLICLERIARIRAILRSATLCYARANDIHARAPFVVFGPSGARLRRIINPSFALFIRLEIIPGNPRESRRPAWRVKLIIVASTWPD